MDVSPSKTAGTPGEPGRSRSAFVTAVRMTFVVLVLTVTLLNIIQTEGGGPGAAAALAERWWLPMGFALVLVGGFLAIDLLTPRKKISTLSGVSLGLLVGLLSTVALGFVIDLVAESWDLKGGQTERIISTVKILVGISMCYMGITTVLQTQDDFRLVIPYVEFAKQMRGVRPLVLDTSSLIDARIVEVCETGVSQAPVVVPQFVISELQRLADSGDKLKRARGRRGLDVVARLQRAALLDVTIDERPMPQTGVDQMLVELARQLPGVIVTADVGLGQVAAIRGVPVLNLNDLANALKPNSLPGESLTLQVVRRGEQKGQGVGYLPDGTMVVVEDGADAVGQEATVTVTSTLQTSAGRLIFGRIGPAEIARPREDAGGVGGGMEGSAPEDGEIEGGSVGRSGSPGAPEGGAGRPGPFPPHGPSRPNRARNPRR